MEGTKNRVPRKRDTKYIPRNSHVQSQSRFPCEPQTRSYMPTSAAYGEVNYWANSAPVYQPYQGVHQPPFYYNQPPQQMVMPHLPPQPLGAYMPTTNGPIAYQHPSLLQAPNEYVLWDGYGFQPCPPHQQQAWPAQQQWVPQQPQGMPPSQHNFWNLGFYGMPPPFQENGEIHTQSNGQVTAVDPEECDSWEGKVSRSKLRATSPPFKPAAPPAGPSADKAATSPILDFAGAVKKTENGVNGGSYPVDASDPNSPTPPSPPTLPPASSLSPSSPPALSSSAAPLAPSPPRPVAVTSPTTPTASTAPAASQAAPPECVPSGSDISPAPSKSGPAPSQSTPAPSQSTPAPSQSTPAPIATEARARGLQVKEAPSRPRGRGRGRDFNNKNAVKPGVTQNQSSKSLPTTPDPTSQPPTQPPAHRTPTSPSPTQTPVTSSPEQQSPHTPPPAEQPVAANDSRNLASLPGPTASASLPQTSSPVPSTCSGNALLHVAKSVGTDITSEPSSAPTNGAGRKLSYAEMASQKPTGRPQKDHAPRQANAQAPRKCEASYPNGKGYTNVGFIRGIQNQNNKCFGITVLQFMMQASGFRDYLHKAAAKCPDLGHYPLLQALCKFEAIYFQGGNNNNNKTPSALAAAEMAPIFKALDKPVFQNGQHDPEEFYVDLLNALNSEQLERAESTDEEGWTIVKSGGSTKKGPTAIENQFKIWSSNQGASSCWDIQCMHPDSSMKAQKTWKILELIPAEKITGVGRHVAFNLPIGSVKSLGDTLFHLSLEEEIHFPLYTPSGDKIKKTVHLRLDFVIFHIGEKIESGHFIAYRRCEGQWFKMNDHRISKATLENVKEYHHSLGQHANWPMPAMLFYTNLEAACHI